MASEINHRLVHLDLKGAPPKLSYLQQIIPLLKGWNATGLLLEYEDTFPYWGELEVLSSHNAYRRDDITKLLKLAEVNGLTVIPLVQTFGHFEFVLKHEQFVGLREVKDFPMALCPSNPECIRILKMMIDQVLSLHPVVQWFHIGADEVYHIGRCKVCEKRMGKEGLTKEKLFLSHVCAVLNYIRQTRPVIKCIMWDDMFRFTDGDVLQASGIGLLVEPMVWDYSRSLRLPDMWDKYCAVFSNIWMASAFKGASGAFMYATDITHHMENHLSWLTVLENLRSKFKGVRGIALTGWQRYDHYAVLCELLPAALPSLAVCLWTFYKEHFSSATVEEVSKDLRFTTPLPLNPFLQRPEQGIPECNFPGSDIYIATVLLSQLYAQYDIFMGDQRHRAWMNQHNVKRNFINPAHLQPLIPVAERILHSFAELERNFQSALRGIFFEDTVVEMLGVYVFPKMKQLKEFIETAKSQVALKGVIPKNRLV